MSNFETRLDQARSGNGILFCGAGFTADCLNFNPDMTIGVGSHLLNVFNEKLRQEGKDYGYQSIRNAADAFRSSFGETHLMNLLIERFSIRNISSDIVDIMQFPWERIYTTNYDDGIELALHSAKRQYSSFNNLDSPRTLTKSLSVIHLHGFVKKWDLHNFNSSCILGSESYHQLDAISEWLNMFRLDVERAELLVFVGFNAGDFHLNNVLFNVKGVHEKIFFINRSVAEPNPDVRMTQERFGQPNYIGRTGFAKTIIRILQNESPKEPKLESFWRYESPEPESTLPNVKDIEDLFLFGRINKHQVARDATLGRSDYHMHRPIIDEILNASEKEVRIVLLVGEICDGKTLILENLSNRLSINRQVFCLRHPYEDLLNEVSGILHVYPRAVLIIENCFDLREDRLSSLAHRFEGSEGLLLLSSRNISVEAESARIHSLKRLRNFRQYSIGSLEDEEVNSLIPLIDQIAAWRHFQADNTIASRKRFIVNTCNNSLPGFLLRLLKSKHVRERYRQEYNKTENLPKTERTAIIAALYISHIGHDTPLGFLSNAIRIDVGGMLDKFDQIQNGLRLVYRRGNYVQTVPSIGATNILEHMISDRDIVCSIVTILHYLSEYRRYDDFEDHIFGQMMRYSILQSVVKDRNQINQFFNIISKDSRLRNQILFWLQWHIAKVDMQEFNEAEKYLEQAYTMANSYERRTGNNYNRRQIDDRKAKFLMFRARYIERNQIDLYRDMREACQIAARLFREEILTHHPFQTLKVIVETFISKQGELLGTHQDPIRHMIDDLIERATAGIQKVPQGYQESRATEAVNDVIRLMPQVKRQT